MRIIPVVDLLDGVVVRARFGDRASYRPIETPLSPDAQVLNVVAGLMDLAPFDTLYCADLDAIVGRPGHDAVIEAIAGRFPQLDLWVDNGIGGLSPAEAWLGRHPHARLVLGSESQASAGLVDALGDGVVLSLDFRGDVFQGPPDLIGDAAHWPTDVVAMTLSRVGSGLGPDLDRLAAVRALAGADRKVFAAGGVRGPEDLLALQRAGIEGALVASALHDGRLDREVLAAFTARG